MLNGLLQKFPEPFTPNKSQVKLIKSIEQAFEEGYKFVVCSAPTGSGKSFISKTLGNDSNEPSVDYVDLVEYMNKKYDTFDMVIMYWKNF